MIITLPRLMKLEKMAGLSKQNVIVHLLAESTNKQVVQVSQKRGQLIVKDEENIQYLLTTNKKVIADDFDYVLLIQSFTQTDINNSTIKIVGWLKNPLSKNYATEEICESWDGQFNFKKEDPTNKIIGLRIPQIGAIHSILGHLTNATDIANIVLPTGTGKTETMLSVLVANKCGRVLVTVPSDALRAQLASKFIDFGWLKRKDVDGNSIVSDSAMYPIVGILNSSFEKPEALETFLTKCNVIISTMNLVSGQKKRYIELFSQKCSHLFVDEAHHSAAANWKAFIGAFEKKKVLQFTATPYRNDGEILDGKTIYNFTLKEAQEQEYFKTIDFEPVREYEIADADKKISEVAVARLRKDLSEEHDHILMARCNNHYRADEVFKNYYQRYTDLNPVVIHSDVDNLSLVKKNIADKKHKIIVCVDMLGEGFDLPELKIAAFHDVRKSLPITLQFAGRFTRTSKDENLGNACFIANMYQPGIDDVLSMLYTRDSNWNTILPTLSLQATQEQVDLKEFMEGFDRLDEFIIPLQDIRPAFSAVVYRNDTNSWIPNKFTNGIRDYDNYDYSFVDFNRKAKTIIALLGSKKPVEWSRSKDVYTIDWDIYIVYWETKNNLLFIHSSDKSSLHKEIAENILGENALLIKDKDVFKSLYKIDRLKVFNLGLRKGLGKNITFQSYYGRGVQEGLSLSEEKSGINNNLFGSGFEGGEITSIGASRKGRIWSYSRGTVNTFINWCDELSSKLSNTNIDGDEILLTNTIKPKKVSEKPESVALSVDWSPEIYSMEHRVCFEINSSEKYNLSNTELSMVIDESSQSLEFLLKSEDIAVPFRILLSKKKVGKEDEYFFKTEKIDSSINAKVKVGTKVYEMEQYFDDYPPIIWFHDGSYLHGNDYITFREDIFDFPQNDLEAWDWNEVQIDSESEGFGALNKDSIQYFCIQRLLLENYDIVFNDDNSGEIADIVAIRDEKERIVVDLFHLKFALKGEVSNNIENLYEICGQAQKSLIWRHRENNEDLFNRLLKREHTKNKNGLSRIRKGSKEDLERLLRVSKIKPIAYNISIVQPAISKQNVSKQILSLLGVTLNHLKKEGGIDLKVIVNE